MKISEGYIPFKGYRTWYRIVGECVAGKLPLLALHGGPGAAHDYLESMDEIASDGRAVIYYDQLGCGKSPVPSNPDMWQVELFVEELAAVRSALGLDKLHIYGQSWGGMLAMQYALTQPPGVCSMILSSSPASLPLWASEARRLLSALPQEMRQAVEAAEQTGDYGNPAYHEAMGEYYKRHVCSVTPYPDFVMRSFNQLGEVYSVMQGPSEFNPTGNLKDWDITARLGEIKIPTLIISGDMDEATPLISHTIHDGIVNSRWELMHGTHFIHIEQTQAYNAIIEDYLNEIEKSVSF